MSSLTYLAALLWVYVRLRGRRPKSQYNVELIRELVRSFGFAFVSNTVVSFLYNRLIAPPPQKAKKVKPVDSLPSVIALDLDGTLFDDNSKISERTNKTLSDFAKSGGILVFATQQPIGGAKRFLSKVSASLTENAYCICGGGSVLIHTSDWSIRDVNLVPSSIITMVIEECSSLLGEGWRMSIDGINGWYTSDESFFSIIDIKMPGVGSKLKKHATIVRDDFSHSLQNAGEHNGAIRVLFLHETITWDKGIETVKIAVEKISKKTGFPLAAVPTGHENSFEVAQKGLGKAGMLKLLCKRIGITSENIVAFGDGENDREMIEFAGLGIAMKNGDASLKQIADKVSSKTNNEDGVAVEIEKLMEKYDEELLRDNFLRTKISQVKALEMKQTQMDKSKAELKKILTAALDLEARVKDLQC
mmetsp:Transcript_8473/g.11040  ORF Transcript_8473/g.11040 Transcript_8473/m.11040 type:complete len:418 (+) Transcript_8473:90-1343(+)